MDPGVLPPQKPLPEVPGPLGGLISCSPQTLSVSVWKHTGVHPDSLNRLLSVTGDGGGRGSPLPPPPRHKRPKEAGWQESEGLREMGREARAHTGASAARAPPRPWGHQPSQRGPASAPPSTRPPPPCPPASVSFPVKTVGCGISPPRTNAQIK